MVNHLLSQNRLNDEQFRFFVDMLDTSTQKSVLLHAGGGTGKTFVTCKIFEEARQNEICHCTCPTGVGALHLPQGQTLHSVFETWAPSLSAGTAIDEIPATATSSLRALGALPLTCIFNQTFPI